MSKIGLGLWGISEWSSYPREQILSLAESSNITIVDTAPVYGGDTRSEKVLSQYPLLKVSTKIPSSRSPNQELESQYPIDHVRKHCRNSFSNIGSRKIEYLCLHNWSPHWTVNQDYLNKIRDETDEVSKSFGVSLPRDISKSDMNRILDYDTFDFFHIHYNIYASENSELIKLAKNRGKKVFIKSPLEHGLLLGTQVNPSESRFKSKTASYYDDYYKKVKQPYTFEECIEFCDLANPDVIFVSLTKPEHFNNLRGIK